MSPAVQQLFQGKANQTSQNSHDPSRQDQQSPASGNPPTKKSGSRSNSATIAGAVAGSTAMTALWIIAAVFFTRRKRRNSGATTNVFERVRPFEAELPKELSAAPNPQELPDHFTANAELADTSRSEISGISVRAELAACG